MLGKLDLTRYVVVRILALGANPELLSGRGAVERTDCRVEMGLVVGERRSIERRVQLTECEVRIGGDGAIEMFARDDEPLSVEVAQSLVELIARGCGRRADRAGMPDGLGDNGSRRLCGGGGGYCSRDDECESGRDKSNARH